MAFQRDDSRTLRGDWDRRGPSGALRRLAATIAVGGAILSGVFILTMLGTPIGSGGHPVRLILLLYPVLVVASGIGSLFRWTTGAICSALALVVLAAIASPSFGRDGADIALAIVLVGPAVAALAIQLWGIVFDRP